MQLVTHETHETEPAMRREPAPGIPAIHDAASACRAVALARAYHAAGQMEAVDVGMIEDQAARFLKAPARQYVADESTMSVQSVQ